MITIKLVPVDMPEWVVCVSDVVDGVVVGVSTVVIAVLKYNQLGCDV